MKFALIDGEKVEASEGAKGFCPSCKEGVFARCGAYRIKHWAHKGNRGCDPWWESETEWHRGWKNLFPKEWQENIHIDSVTGEKHIADIKTDKGLVIEFQHSAINSDEVKSREDFYKNMVWVVDGARLKKDYPRFCKGLSARKPTLIDSYFEFSFPASCFHKSWLESSKPAYFDFLGSAPQDQLDEVRDALWCLLPRRVDQPALVARIQRKKFIESSLTDPSLLPNRDRFFEQVNRIQSAFTEAIEATAALKKQKEWQVAAYQRYRNSLIPRRFMRRPL